MAAPSIAGRKRTAEEADLPDVETAGAAVAAGQRAPKASARALEADSGGEGSASETGAGKRRRKGGRSSNRALWERIIPVPGVIEDSDSDDGLRIETFLCRRREVPPGTPPDTPLADLPKRWEYMCKWAGKSHLHASWEPEADILMHNTKRMQRRLDRWVAKSREEAASLGLASVHGVAANPAEDWEVTEEGPPMPDDWMTVDRVLDASVGPEQDCQPGSMYLIKWVSLPYSDATWEDWDDFQDEGGVAAFRRREQVPPRSEWRRPVPLERPSLKQGFKKIPTEATYGPQGFKLRDYQLQGVNWLLFNWQSNRACILGDEMGLGKTAQSVLFLRYLKQRHNATGPFLVVGPLSTIPHWAREVEAWGNMNVVLYHGNAMARDVIAETEFYHRAPDGTLLKPKARKSAKSAAALEPQPPYKFDVLVTTYEMVNAERETLEQIRWQVLIVDEAHRLRNTNARLFRELSQVPRDHCVLLTGTPIQNNIQELWSMLHFASPASFPAREGSAWLRRFGDLKDAFQVAELHKILKPFLLRRRKEDINTQLPPKEEMVLEVELTVSQKQFYRAIYERNTAFLVAGNSRANAPNLMNIMMELRKCCNHPFLIQGAEHRITTDPSLAATAAMDATSAEESGLSSEPLVTASGKMILLDKLLPRLRAGGHKVLIFSQMVRMLDILGRFCASRKYLYERIDGRIRGAVRQAAIDRFSSPDSAAFVMLLSTRAGGLGINLTAADTVIIFDSDWNPQNDLQAQARAHRIGQKNAVNIYRLITHKSYEQHMFHQASLKLGLDQAVMSHMRSKGDSAPSSSEVEELLKRGAYDVFNEDGDAATRAFITDDIDTILNRAKRVSWDKAKGPAAAAGAASALNSLSKAAFVTEGANEVDIDDPEFWTKLVGLKPKAQQETLLDVGGGLRMNAGGDLLDEAGNVVLESGTSRRTRTGGSMAVKGGVGSDSEDGYVDDEEEEEGEAYVPPTLPKRAVAGVMEEEEGGEGDDASLAGVDPALHAPVWAGGQGHPVPTDTPPGLALRLRWGRLERPWSSQERNRFHAALQRYGWGRWLAIKSAARLTRRSVLEVVVFARGWLQVVAGIAVRALWYARSLKRQAAKGRTSGNIKEHAAAIAHSERVGGGGHPFPPHLRVCLPLAAGQSWLPWDAPSAHAKARMVKHADGTLPGQRVLAEAAALCPAVPPHRLPAVLLDGDFAAKVSGEGALKMLERLDVLLAIRDAVAMAAARYYAAAGVACLRDPVGASERILGHPLPPAGEDGQRDTSALAALAYPGPRPPLHDLAASLQGFPMQELVTGHGLLDELYEAGKTGSLVAGVPESGPPPAPPTGAPSATPASADAVHSGAGGAPSASEGSAVDAPPVDADGDVSLEAAQAPQGSTPAAPVYVDPEWFDTDLGVQLPYLAMATDVSHLPRPLAAIAGGEAVDEALALQSAADWILAAVKEGHWPLHHAYVPPISSGLEKLGLSRDFAAQPAHLPPHVHFNERMVARVPATALVRFMTLAPPPDSLKQAASWWDAAVDAAVVLGTWEHGWGRADALRNDPHGALAMLLKRINETASSEVRLPPLPRLLLYTQPASCAKVLAQLQAGNTVNLAAAGVSVDEVRKLHRSAQANPDAPSAAEAEGDSGPAVSHQSAAAPEQPASEGRTAADAAQAEGSDQAEPGKSPPAGPSAGPAPEGGAKDTGDGSVSPPDGAPAALVLLDGTGQPLPIATLSDEQLLAPVELPSLDTPMLAALRGAHFFPGTFPLAKYVKALVTPSLTPPAADSDPLQRVRHLASLGGLYVPILPLPHVMPPPANPWADPATCKASLESLRAAYARQEDRSPPQCWVDAAGAVHYTPGSTALTLNARSDHRLLQALTQAVGVSTSRLPPAAGGMRSWAMPGLMGSMKWIVGGRATADPPTSHGDVLEILTRVAWRLGLPDGLGGPSHGDGMLTWAAVSAALRGALQRANAGSPRLTPAALQAAVAGTLLPWLEAVAAAPVAAPASPLSDAECLHQLFATPPLMPLGPSTPLATFTCLKEAARRLLWRCALCSAARHMARPLQATLEGGAGGVPCPLLHLSSGGPVDADTASLPGWWVPALHDAALVLAVAVAGLPPPPQTGERPTDSVLAWCGTLRSAASPPAASPPQGTLLGALSVEGVADWVTASAGGGDIGPWRDLWSVLGGATPPPLAAATEAVAACVRGVPGVDLATPESAAATRPALLDHLRKSWPSAAVLSGRLEALGFELTPLGSWSVPDAGAEHMTRESLAATGGWSDGPLPADELGATAGMPAALPRPDAALMRGWAHHAAHPLPVPRPVLDRLATGQAGGSGSDLALWAARLGRWGGVMEGVEPPSAWHAAATASATPGDASALIPPPGRVHPPSHRVTADCHAFEMPGLGPVGYEALLRRGVPGPGGGGAHETLLRTTPVVLDAPIAAAVAAAVAAAEEGAFAGQVGGGGVAASLPPPVSTATTPGVWRHSDAGWAACLPTDGMDTAGLGLLPLANMGLYKAST